MKQTTPAVKAIIEAVKVADVTLTEEQIETLLREGKPMDIKTVAILSPRKDYGPQLMALARSFAD